LMLARSSKLRSGVEVVGVEVVSGIDLGKG
jgi:hypothetical protein